MNLLGFELPPRIEILGVYFLVNPATIFVACLLFGLACAALFYALRRRTVESATYAKEFDFFGGVGYSPNGVADPGNVKVTPQENGLVSIEEEITQPMEVSALSENEPAYKSYVNDEDALSKAFGDD